MQATGLLKAPYPAYRYTFPLKLNYMGKFVEWLKNSETPLLKKVGATFLVAAALFTIASISKPAAFIVGGGALLCGLEQSVKLWWAAEKNRELESTDSKMFKALGKNREEFPVFSGITDVATPKELSHPIMRALDSSQNLCVVLKIKDKTNTHIFLAEFCLIPSFFPVERVSHWELRLREKDTEYQQLFGHEKDQFKTIKDIVENKHPRFELFYELP